MRSVTTLSTQRHTPSIRKAHAGLRLRMRCELSRELRRQRRPVRGLRERTRRSLSRMTGECVARVVTQRARPTPQLRGFLPLYRH